MSILIDKLTGRPYLFVISSSDIVDLPIEVFQKFSNSAGAGTHQITFDSDFPDDAWVFSGVPFYRLLDGTVESPEITDRTKSGFKFTCSGSGQLEYCIKHTA